MSTDLRKAREIFLHAVGKLPPEQWEGHIAEACGADSDLAQQVSSLLQVHREAGSFLNAPAPGLDVTLNQPYLERPGTQIGPYKLLQQIGEGGMGVVYMAEQTEPVQRKVALKVIKPGMDSRQVIARFDAEKQALGMMDHVNIARVLDAGTTGGEPGGVSPGRPYFVMELVHGIPITKYCDDNRLTPRQRLELFVPVCQAIQHAHQKGIIHRDIKPSNVMVTLYDGKPVPKVIDFGVAKATEQKLTERTLFTQYGTMVGTLEYMSPEQAEMSALGVDTRSDIYSLGVLLYELLTGSTPLSSKQMKEVAYAEILRLIKEEEPPKPSTRLSESGEALASISAQRHTEPAKLSKLMRGELDWIVMKTLEKDRNRRYETASGFAADVQRYLDDEPVQACPPSAGYRLRKFARRNKGPVLAASVILLCLIGGIIGTTLGLVEAKRQERIALAEAVEKENARAAEAQQRQDAETQRDRARTAEKLAKDRLAEVTKEKERATTAEKNAKEEAAIAQAVNHFLQVLLAEAAPEKNARNKKVTVEELLGRAAAEITGRFDQQPRIEAAIRQTIGDTYRRLGDYPAAQPHLERAWDFRRRVLGEEHRDTLSSMNNLALLYMHQGKFAKAEPLFIQGLEVSRRVLGEEHRDTLSSMNNLASLYMAQNQYAMAEPLYAKALEVSRRVRGEEHSDTLTSMINSAELYRHQRQFAKAEPLYLKALEVSRRVRGEEHPLTLIYINNLALLYQDQGQYQKAEPLNLRTLEVSRRVLGEEHPDTLTSMSNLASLYKAKSEYAKAEPLFVKALEVSRRVLGEEHPATLKSMINSAELYQDQGQHPKAEPLLVKALEIRRRVQGEEHPDTLRTMNNLATLYQHEDQYAKAEPLFVKALEVSRRVLGEEHLSTLTVMNNLATVYRDQDQYAKAEPLLVKALEVSRRVLGEEHPGTLQVMNSQATLYLAQSQYAKAEPLFVKTLDVSRRVLGEEHPFTLSTMNNLAGLYLAQGQYAKAEPLFVQALDINRRVHGDEHPDTLRAMNNLAALYHGQGQFPKAEPLYVKTLEVSRRVLGEEHPDTLRSINNLAALYQDQGQLAKAEVLFRDALQQRRKHHGERSMSVANGLGNLGFNLLLQKRSAEAEPLLRECLAFRSLQEPDAWRTFNTKSQLGGSLLDQKKYADAEPLLLAGYEGLKEREAKIQAISKVRLAEALERLIQLYDATGQKEKAAEWRKELEAPRGADKKVENPKEK